jgi:hydrogenase maturation protease
VTAPVVVFAVGNPSRGDDALGPVLAERVSDWLALSGLADAVEVIEDFQLQIEHALDLQGRSLALFIDAGESTPAPLTLQPTGPAPLASHSTHALAPEAVLEVYRRTEGAEPPPAYVLCIRGEDFGLGAPLTAAAGERAGLAMDVLRELLANPLPSAWQSVAARLAGGPATRPPGDA